LLIFEPDLSEVIFSGKFSEDRQTDANSSETTIYAILNALRIKNSRQRRTTGRIFRKKEEKNFMPLQLSEPPRPSNRKNL